MSSHLTADALVVEFAALDDVLNAGGECLYLVVDSLAMTGYDPEARDLFVRWHAEHRAHMRGVGVVTDRMLWRMVVGAMALASRQTMRTFSGVQEALEWALTDDESKENFE